MPTVFKLLKWSQDKLGQDISFPELISISPLEFTNPDK